MKKNETMPVRHYVDRKVTVWRREFYDLTGTPEENVAFLKKECKDPEYGNEFVDSQFLGETEETVVPENGEATAVAYRDDGDEYLGVELATNVDE